MIFPGLTLSIIRYVSRVKWRNPGKGVVPSLTPRHSSYWKESLCVNLDYGCQLYLLIVQSLGSLAHWGLLTLWSWPIWQNCCQETTFEEAKQSLLLTVVVDIFFLQHCFSFEMMFEVVSLLSHRLETDEIVLYTHIQAGT